MEFLNGTCPHCHGVLQLPTDRETVLCMYCGRELAVKDALADGHAPLKTVTEEEAVTALQELVYGIEDPMQYFKKALYMDFFKKYVYENAGNLALLEQYYQNNPEKEALERVAQPLVSRVASELSALRGRKKDDRQMDANLSMVVYLFPALLETNEASAQAWIDVLVAVWKRQFPKTELKAATAKEINAGFRYRFCFITTAVCESQGKPDDCYELSLFRSFRDEYLLKRPDGEAMVHEYYDVAPTIVKHIGRKENASQIYDGIWQQYLSPCVRLIEADRREECTALYRQMVDDLRQQYFH